MTDSISINKKYESADLLWHVWMPINEAFNANYEVYYSTEGILNYINVQVANGWFGIPLTALHGFHRLSSTRELLTMQSKSTISSAVLYGDIGYQLSSETMRNQAFTKMRSLRSLAIPLEHSKEEISAIELTLKKQKIDVQIEHGSAANEESFGRLSLYNPFAADKHDRYTIDTR